MWVETKLSIVPLFQHRCCGPQAVGEVVGAFLAGVGVEVEWQQDTGRVQRGPTREVLREHAKRASRMIVEPPAGRVGAEVVVVGAVLHHEEDDVLHRAEVGTGGRRGGRPPDQPCGAAALRPGGGRPGHHGRGSGQPERHEHLAAGKTRRVRAGI